ncbi:MAG TPA: MlaD family protein [Solirubrobacteraceae bacterium]|nr:MlaD family protein [Solirubrobacteraceae bacterium]
MKRVIALLLLFAVVFAGMALLLVSSGRSGYKVDAIFDQADFLIPGQDVRIAGAAVGQISGIGLTANHKARVEMTIDPKFGPFHADATCAVVPQSLIGDRFVDCTPGTPAQPALKPTAGQPPTVPVANTSSPVDLDEVLQTLNLPVRERAALLLDSLGVGLTARGSDLNATILRANPALQETRKVLGILNQNRAQLQSLISASDVVLGRLAVSRQRVGAFVHNSATILNTTASNRAALAQDISRLPPLLEQARPALTELTAFAKQGTAPAEELNAAAPSFNSLLGQLQTFAPQVLPTVKKLGNTATVLQNALPSVTPQVQRLRTFASVAPASGQLLASLFSSMRSQGAVDGLLEFAYYAAAAFARYDNISHILPAYAMATPCEAITTTPFPGCNAHFSSYTGPGAQARRASAAHARQTGSAHAPTRTAASPGATGAPAAAAPPSASSGSSATAPTTTPATTTTTATPQPPPNVLSSLLRFLLR